NVHIGLPQVHETCQKCETSRSCHTSKHYTIIVLCVPRLFIAKLYLIPLFFFIGGGCTMSLTYLARLALRNPDVCWDRKNNPEPWNKLGPTDQYKFYAVSMDYSKLKKDRPDF
uniref:Cytochrome c oxidase subunit NDUFA4 n=1 Tax=Cyprinus carpio carpio TaxID=630221 RepID=A0A9J8CHE8_CYPCA